uniref:2'-5'-oligoadenylate synthase 3-like n=1 Tax=Geotrypetes seraphini TaxID=260995 RepID=A0A6P8S291_GEOSA|nr:2'-5'-oligoadenylate synthase 3-like [Geotrypetes seraphini]
MSGNPCSACLKANIDLCNAKEEDLNIFISKKLQPDQDFLDKMGNVVDTICTFLKEDSFKESKVKVLKVVKGGSTGKGTTLKGRSDVDLVVFLNCFEEYKDQENNRKEIIEQIRRKLETYTEGKDFTVTIENSKWTNPRVLSFQLKLPNYEVDCDVLPAYDALGHNIVGYQPHPKVYENLLNSHSNREFSTCFTELQRDFVKGQPTKVKSLIRLVKYWYKSVMYRIKISYNTAQHCMIWELTAPEQFYEESDCPTSHIFLHLSPPMLLPIISISQASPSYLGRASRHFEDKPEVKKLPPKYALELLTIRAWEEDGKKKKFKTDQVFHKVLKLILNYETLCVYWSKYYDESFLKLQLSKCRPIIIDPGDPTGNLGEGFCWNEVAKAAACCLSQPSSVELTIKRDNQQLHRVSINPYTKIQQIKETLGISTESGSLFLGDQELSNHYTLAHYGIFYSTVLILKTQGSYCTILQLRDSRRTDTAAMSGNPCSACLKANIDLCNAKEEDLNIFISKKLQPDQDFLDKMGNVVDKICTFLKEDSFKESKVKVLKVVKGGSTGKGTTLKGRSDADLVVFLNCFKEYRDQENNRKEIIEQIRRKLETYTEDKDFTVTIENSKWSNPRVLSFQLKLPNYEDVVECDVLPAYDALGHIIVGYRPHPQVYEKLLYSHPNGGFSTCFTELQRDFVKGQPTKVKSLIRLVKYWYKSYFEDKPEVKNLPRKYALELLTIRAWEEDGKKEKFKTDQVFRKVLESIVKYKTLCVYWLNYYDFRFVKSQLRKPRPIIMDPADPTGNLGEDFCWIEVAKAAACCLSQPSSVELMITQDNQLLHRVSINPYTKIQQIKERLGISTESESLFLGDQELSNHYTLAHYGIFYSTVLILKTQGSYCTILTSGNPMNDSYPEEGPYKFNACIQIHLKEDSRRTDTAAMSGNPCSACLKANIDLCNAKEEDLNIFISKKLQPDEYFLFKMGNVVDTICTFLKEDSFKGFELNGSKVKVLKVVKGGSTGKGTTLKGRSDADLVVFLNCFKKYKDQENNRKEIIEQIRRKLETYPKGKDFTVTIENSKWPNPRGLTFQLKFTNYEDVVECDVLPAYDALGQVTVDYSPPPQVYENLLYSHPKGGFSTCFTELQRDFVKDQPTKVKSLIRLVKYWYKSHFEDKPEVKKLPPKYALELLTIHAWEEDGKKEKFKTDQVFHKVLELILNYETLCVYWSKYYDESFLKLQLSKCSPIIMDPADPTGNLGEGFCWNEVAKAAACCLHLPSSVELMITQDNQLLHRVSINPYTKIQQIKERLGISTESESLFLGDQELSNHYTLAHYGIFYSTVLILKTQGSYCTIL